MHFRSYLSSALLVSFLVIDLTCAGIIRPQATTSEDRDRLPGSSEVTGRRASQSRSYGSDSRLSGSYGTPYGVVTYNTDYPNGAPSYMPGLTNYGAPLYPLNPTLVYNPANSGYLPVYGSGYDTVYGYNSQNSGSSNRPANSNGNNRRPSQNRGTYSSNGSNRDRSSNGRHEDTYPERDYDGYYDSETYRGGYASNGRYTSTRGY